MIPSNPIAKNIASMLSYAHKRQTAGSFIKSSMIVSAALSAILTALSLLVFSINLNLSGISLLVIMLVGCFIAVNLINYLNLYLEVSKKSRFIEKLMPDFLDLVVSNLKAGLTIEKSFINAAKPEFGFFQDDIKDMYKDITFGAPLDKALLKLSLRTKSDKIRKIVELLSTGMSSGGEIAPLLEQLSINMRNQEQTDEKVRSSITGYVIFITIALCIGAPALLAISSFLVKVFISLFSNVEIPAGTAIAFASFAKGGITVTEGFIAGAIVIFLIISNILGSMLIGEIRKGRAIYGLTYSFMLVPASLAVFFIVRFLISNVFGFLFGI